MSWQSYWVEFQPDEVRACDGCHGSNVVTQAGPQSPNNTPLALIALLNRCKNLTSDAIFAAEFETGQQVHTALPQKLIDAFLLGVLTCGWPVAMPRCIRSTGQTLRMSFRPR